MALPFYFHRMNSTESARRYGGDCEQEGQLKNARIRDHYSSGQSIDTVTVYEAIIEWENCPTPISRRGSLYGTRVQYALIPQFIRDTVYSYDISGSHSMWAMPLYFAMPLVVESLVGTVWPAPPVVSYCSSGSG